MAVLIKRHESRVYNWHTLQWTVPVHYTVEVRRWFGWKPVTDGDSKHPAKFFKLKAARRAAHEVQVGLRTLRNEQIVEAYD